MKVVELCGSGHCPVIKTHLIGGRLFKAAGLVVLLGVFFQHYAILFVLIPVVLVSLFTIAYSYFEYQKERATQQ